MFSVKLMLISILNAISQALSLRKQVESIKKERAAMGIAIDSPCGPGAPCRAKLEAMTAAHQKALQELQERHEREIRELEEQKNRMLEDEIQTAAKGKEEVLSCCCRKWTDTVLSALSPRASSLNKTAAPSCVLFYFKIKFFVIYISFN